MEKLSLAMIVKNEEKVLDRCLSSIKDMVDEIVIVDTGSTDETKAIARKHTNKVFDFEWVDDFSKARNYSFSKCSNSHIMWLDADDVFDEKNKKEFLLLKNNLKNCDVVMMKYDIAFDTNGKPTFSYFRERIVRNDPRFVWKDPVHEAIACQGRIVYSNLAIKHLPLKKEKHSTRNLKIYQNLVSRGEVLSARQEYYFARELMFNGLFEDAIKMFESFLERKDAWKENSISACRDLAHCQSQLGKDDNAVLSLLKSFQYDQPRGEVCCALGEIFLSKKQPALASYWFLRALESKPDLHSGGFIEQEFYGVVPCLQLCVCFFQMGEYEKAKKYNDLAGEFSPTNTSFINNKKYFEEMK